jgi:aminopeptidase
MLGKRPHVQVIVRDREWVQEQKMAAFLSVSAGGGLGGEPLKFLEIHYKGGGGVHPASPTFGLVGKGVTFDSGGISLKPSTDMALMKGDMGGAACVLSTIWGVSQLELPVNLIACIPLTENMPSGTATKPGDVVFAANGLSIEVDNTGSFSLSLSLFTPVDAEGRLILADALHYLSSTYKPDSIVELSTLTGSMSVALGEGMIFLSLSLLFSSFHWSFFHL